MPKKEISSIKLDIHELKQRIDNLEADSHKPIFKKSAYKDLSDRIEIIEAFFENIALITKNKKDFD